MQQPVMNQPVIGQPVAKSWLSRNAKWVVPGGCLTLLVIVACFVGVILTFVSGAMKSSDAYTHALASARANPAVIAALGTPISDGFLPSGSVNTTGSSGTADLSIPISGPKGSGTIQVEARRSAGGWTYTVLSVKLASSGKTIDLLH